MTPFKNLSYQTPVAKGSHLLPVKSQKRPKLSYFQIKIPKKLLGLPYPEYKIPTNKKTMKLIMVFKKEG
jgi:hypothetical protein